MLEILYQSVIARVIYISVLCKAVGVRVEGSINARRINKLIHKVGTITVQNQNLESERNRRSLKKKNCRQSTSPGPFHTIEAAELRLPQTYLTLLPQRTLQDISSTILHKSVQQLSFL